MLRERTADQLSAASSKESPPGSCTDTSNLSCNRPLYGTPVFIAPA